MSELLHGQTSACTKREKLVGFTQALASPRKSVQYENETKKQEKNDTQVKMLFMEGSP